MAKVITIALHGVAARALVTELADRYCRMTVYSRLPRLTVNSPWNGGADQWAAAIAGYDRRRADYRKTLQSFIPDLPPPPVIEWQPYKSPTNGKTYPAHFQSTKMAEAARAYADLILKEAGL